jgi:hypothetical protein
VLLLPLLLWLAQLEEMQLTARTRVRLSSSSRLASSIRCCNQHLLQHLAVLQVLTCSMS